MMNPTKEPFDTGHGECCLRRPELAPFIEGALLHFTIGHECIS